MQGERDRNIKDFNNLSLWEKFKNIKSKMTLLIHPPAPPETEEQKTLRFCRHFDDLSKDKWGIGFSKY